MKDKVPYKVKYETWCQTQCKIKPYKVGSLSCILCINHIDKKEGYVICKEGEKAK